MGENGASKPWVSCTAWRHIRSGRGKSMSGIIALVGGEEFRRGCEDMDYDGICG